MCFIALQLTTFHRQSIHSPPPSSKTVSTNAVTDNTQTRKPGQTLSMDPGITVDYTPQNRFSIERLNILEPDTKDSELIDSFFAKAKAQT